MHDSLHELRALSQAPQFDAKRAKELADAGAAALSDLMLSRARTNSEIFGVLDPEQRRQIEEHRGHTGPMAPHPGPERGCVQPDR